ncbi:hypothetical protein DWUX_1595 [Desulfovibrio diazotrophicus]|nr:hypothetical protein DWUX_1595 [Desulfovibrio diazotrophicus]
MSSKKTLPRAAQKGCRCCDVLLCQSRLLLRMYILKSYGAPVPALTRATT